MRKKIILAVVMALSLSLLCGCGKSTKKTMERYAECMNDVSYTGVEYVPADRTLTQEEIDEEIEHFCNDNAVTEEDYTSAVKEDDLVNIDYTQKLNGSEYSSQTDYSITIGNDTLGTGFDHQLVGAKPGDVREVIVTYPADYSDVALAGLTASFDVTVNYISVTTVPEYSNDLVVTATEGEYTTTEAYTAHLTEELQNSKNESADNTDRTNILQSIIDDAVFIQYPEQEMEDYIVSVVENIRSAADNYGIGFEMYLGYFYGYSNEQDFLKFLSETVISVMQEKIVVSYIAVKENLIATDADIDAYKAETMEELGIAEEEIPDYYSEEDLAFYATEEKVLDYLVAQAVQVDELTEEPSEDTSAADENTAAKE